MTSLLADLVADASAVVVLTGAGISTESGIADFRGPDGLWRDPELVRLAHVDALRDEPAAVWAFYARRFGGVQEAQPNAGHLALAALERHGVVERLVTQNVDGLHRRGGLRPDRGARVAGRGPLRASAGSSDPWPRPWSGARPPPTGSRAATAAASCGPAW